MEPVTTNDFGGHWRAAVNELWGVVVDPNSKSPTGYVARYGLDTLIENHLECEIREGRLDYPRRAPEVAADELATKALRRAIRAAHASRCSPRLRPV